VQVKPAFVTVHVPPMATELPVEQSPAVGAIASEGNVMASKLHRAAASVHTELTQTDPCALEAELHVASVQVKPAFSTAHVSPMPTELLGEQSEVCCVDAPAGTDMSSKLHRAASHVEAIQLDAEPHVAAVQLKPALVTAQVLPAETVPPTTQFPPCVAVAPKGMAVGGEVMESKPHPDDVHAEANRPPAQTHPWAFVSELH